MTCAHPSEHSADFLQCWQRVFLPAMLWGAGTAMGEIPPYAISRSAMLAGERLHEHEHAQDLDASKPLEAMQLWMISFVKKHGFAGVLVMSAWPNAAFDLVGIVCGQIGVPFWTFFSATFIGKALVKVNGQCMFFVFWFRNPEYVLDFAQTVAAQVPLVDSHALQAKLQQGFESVTGGKASKEEEETWGKFLFGQLVLLVVASFVVSCVNQLAQQKQKELNAAKK